MRKSNSKILIVDDKYENLQALQSMLEGESYEIVQASSGRAALKKIMEYKFACVLLDVQMPDMDGYETARIINENKGVAKLPIIFVTAYASEIQPVFEGYESGAVDFLIKPLESFIVKRKIQVFVELFESKQKILEKSEELELLNQQLMDQNRELQRINQLFVGREQRIVELKGEVNSLTKKLGIEQPYSLTLELMNEIAQEKSK